MTQLILARLLAPEAFGLVATVVMVTSFAEMLSDAGFQKYLIQREFENKEQLDQNANVAFWSSMTVSVGLLAIIVVFRDPIAGLAGNPGLGIPLIVASCALPLTVVAGTQQALFRRAFEYKKILPIRVGSAFVTLILAVPLALLGYGYWSLIIGVLGSSLINAIALSIASPWNPRLFYSFRLLREMFSFSGWSLLEAISIWLTTWAGTFIVGNLLTPYELGLYRQPITLVTSIFALVTSATTPILFSALSRLQFDTSEFRRFFLRFQFMVSLFVLPLGACVLFFRDFITYVLLGPQWIDASLMIGLWSLSTAFMIVFSHYCSEVYRALGKPRISLFSQMLYMAFLIPALYLAASDGFTTLVVVNSAVRVIAIVINQTLTFFVAGIGFLSVLKNLRAPLISVVVMSLPAAWLASAIDNDWVISLAGIMICILLYSVVCLCFRRPRMLFLGIFAWIRRRRTIRETPASPITSSQAGKGRS